MSDYRLSTEEEDSLRVAKMNQRRSSNLEIEMNDFNNSWGLTNEENEEFLSCVESRLGIVPNTRESGPEGFRRDGKSAEPRSWDVLVNEAKQEIAHDVDFEDLLTQEEFTTAYRDIERIDKEFEKRTGLCKKDFAFLAVAIALQCIRQYVLDPWLKEHRRGASASDESGRKDNAEAGWYYVDTEKILTNRVPFDVQHYGENSTIQGFLKGGDHRLMTLGHDPVLGWVFGTANIMTSTVTRKDFVSAHVKCINNENRIHSNADTSKIFESVIGRVSNEGIDGKIALGCAIAREAIHLKSDINTKRSLPLPGIGVLSPELGKELARYGIDTASIGTEVTLSCFINFVIAIVHKMCFDETKDERRFYEVRTRKIILYSNLIATTSNVILSVLTEKYNLLDVGGGLVTIGRLITDVRFICKVKDEFLQKELDEHFEGIREEVDLLYDARFCNA